MPDRDLAMQAAEVLLGEDLRHEPHVLQHGQAPLIGDSDARRLLAAVLQREQAEVSDARDIAFGRPDAE